MGVKRTPIAKYQFLMYYHSMKKIYLILGIIAVIGAILVSIKYFGPTTNQIEVVNDPLNTSDWITRLDEKYGFSYMTPPYDKIGTNDYFVINPVYQNPGDTEDLRSYAENFWKQQNEKTPLLPNSMPVSALEEFYLNGREAYRFTQEINFNDINHNDPEKKYNQTNIITSNQNGQLFWAFYKTESAVAEKTLSTLIIDINLIPPKIEPSDWKVIQEGQANFEFSYPANIFTENNGNNNSVLYVSGKRGQMSVNKFEPSEYERIWSYYPGLKNTEKVKVGNMYGYVTRWAEGGNFAVIFLISTDDNYIINVRFDSHERNIHPIASDTELQNQILSTFKFK